MKWRKPQGAALTTNFGAGFHAARGRVVDTSAYDRYNGRWSRLFVPAVLAAAEIAPAYRGLDISTGTGVLSPPPDRAPMWGILADAISRFLPEQRNTLHLSWSLADPKRLEHLLASAGFRDIRVERQKREDVMESFENYWEPIEAGTGSIPQAYLTLSEADRRSVREEVRERFSQFESNGQLLMNVEMLIGRGRA